MIAEVFTACKFQDISSMHTVLFCAKLILQMIVKCRDRRQLSLLEFFRIALNPALDTLTMKKSCLNLIFSRIGTAWNLAWGASWRPLPDLFCRNCQLSLNTRLVEGEWAICVVVGCNNVKLAIRYSHGTHYGWTLVITTRVVSRRFLSRRHVFCASDMFFVRRRQLMPTLWNPVFDCPSVRVSECPSVRVSECPSVRVSECPSVRVSECPSVRVSECPSVRVSECPSVRVSECPSVRVSECPSVRVSECPSVRVSECPSVRVSECPSVRVSECPSVPVSSVLDVTSLTFPQMIEEHKRWHANYIRVRERRDVVFPDGHVKSQLAWNVLVFRSKLK